MNTRETELKPCPFNAEAEKLAEAMEGIVHFVDAVRYRNDVTSVALREWIFEGEKALEAWNLRAQ